MAAAAKIACTALAQHAQLLNEELHIVFDEAKEGQTGRWVMPCPPLLLQSNHTMMITMMIMRTPKCRAALCPLLVCALPSNPM